MFKILFKNRKINLVSNDPKTDSEEEKIILRPKGLTRYLSLNLKDNLLKCNGEIEAMFLKYYNDKEIE